MSAGWLLLSLRFQFSPCLAVLDNVIAVAAILVLLMSAFIADIYQHIAHRTNTTNRGGSKENDKTKVCLLY